ncbi:O-fucosyltransferase 37 [Cynara cardunculus var. scolymus]|uniref:O-fucosyltransferase 37 n=1 Tax=Cynara cardunculus var. scolymus TaxID=59895 RepID=UPI000D622F14|nr:O-fucosyltransferase 37 [Cynara cardunculus var. scolymus]
MAKTKSIKNSILTFNPHLFPHFLYLFSPKIHPRNPHLSLATSTRTLFFFTLLLASILCFVAINPFLNTPQVSIIAHTASYSPLFLASLSSVFQDPSAGDNNDAPVSLSTTAMVPLPPRSVAGISSEFWQQPDGEGFRPCLDFSLKYRRRSRKIANERKRFLVVVVSGGLFQIRNQIVDAVVIARILEAALVLPVLQGDESEFSEIFDVEHFKKILKADIRVVSSLPSTHLVSWQLLENQIPHNVPPFWIRARFFKKLSEEGSLVLTGLESKLSKNLPPDLQKLRCKVAFHALKFATPIRELGNRIARRMWIEGPYVALHLGLEKDVWVRTGCLTGLGHEYDMIINDERESHPEFLATKSNITCPLNALEAARLLKDLGAPANARVYIAGGEPFGGDRAILPLKKEFYNVVTKEMLARDGELNPYRNRTSILAAIDYIVSLSSDVFLPSYDGYMVRALQGHRAYVGHRKFVTTNMSFKGQPEPRAKRRDRDVIAFPVPECMCKH